LGKILDTFTIFKFELEQSLEHGGGGNLGKFARKRSVMVLYSQTRDSFGLGIRNIFENARKRILKIGGLTCKTTWL